jgi:hypothetical protein
LTAGLLLADDLIDSEACVSAAEVKKQIGVVKKLSLLRVSLYHMKEAELIDACYNYYGGAHRASIKNIPEKCLKGKAIDSTVR